jgi:hypothetical protein
MQSAQIEALQEVHVAFNRSVTIFSEDGKETIDECRTRAAMALIAFGITELREIWSRRRVQSAVSALLSRLYEPAGDSGAR